MDTPTPTKEGPRPTPATGTETPVVAPSSSSANPAQAADQTAILTIINETLGKNYPTLEDAKTGLKNLNRMVGDQTIALQREIVAKLSEQTNLSPEAVLDVLNTPSEQTKEMVETTLPQPTRDTVTALEAVRKVQLKEFLRDCPEAKVVKELLLHDMKTTGQDPEILWEQKYEPIYRVGKETGANQLHATIEGQPTKGAAGTSEDTPVLNARNMSIEELEKILPVAPQ